MKGRKIISFLAAVAALALVLCAAAPKRNPVSGLWVTGYSIHSILPSSLRSLSGTVTVTVRNSGVGRSLTNVSATLYQKGTMVARGKCTDMTFPAGTTDVRVSGEVQLCEGISLFRAMKDALSFHPSDYTADIVCSVKGEDGRAETFVRKGIPVGDYLK